MIYTVKIEIDPYNRNGDYCRRNFHLPNKRNKVDLEEYYDGEYWHRENGPAVEWNDGGSVYWFNNKEYPNKEEWELAKNTSV